MKSLLTIIAASLLASAFTSNVLAQWTVQNSGIPTDDQVVLAAVNANVCWGATRVPGAAWVTRTTNGGTNWTASNLTSFNTIGSIAAVSADTAWISATGAIYNTTNGGVNWTQQLTTGSMQIVRFFDSNNGVCIGNGISVSAEIYTTTNRGTAWTQVPSVNIPILVNGEGFIPDNAFVRGRAIWVPTNGGSLYKSTDRGLTWNVTRLVVNQGTGSFCAFKDSLNGLLSSAASNVVKRTTDGGTTWTTTGSIPQGVSPLFMSYIPGTNGSYMVTSVNPPGTLTGSAYTLDSGRTWTTVDNVTHGKAAFVSPSVGWSWGGANIIYKWTGGGVEHWSAQASGIPTSDQVVVAAVNENVCWGVTRAFGARYVTRTTNGGTNWTASNLSALKDFYGIAALNADTAWIAADSAIYKTTNGGVNWTQQLATGMLIIHFFDSNNGVCIGSVAFGGPIVVYTTTDRGSVWTQVSNIPSAAGGAIPSNYAAVGNTLWCPTNGGSLYKTTDRGITWTVTQNVGGTSLGVFVAFKDAANGLATANNTVFRTSDGGANWTSTGSVPNGVSAFLLSYVPGTSGSYMITSNPYPIPTRLNGSAYTLDGGATWTTADTLIHGWSAFVSPSVGWSWGGANVIYKWMRPPLVPSTSVRETREIAKDFRLEQNYPNPFNPSTKISFKLQVSGFTTLKVYDVLGREVRTLVNETLEARSYETTFSAEGLASGVYLYRLQAGDFVQTKKLMLLR